LNEECSGWDADVVRSIFEEDIATRVLQIPVSKRVGADFISWPYTKFGDYTVRLAYHLARSEKFFVDQSKKGVGIHSVAQAEDRLWKKL
jgi:hypothetical protein